MKHLTDNQLIACALGFGERAWDEHCTGCDECASGAAKLRALLDAAAPAAAPAAADGLAMRVLAELPPEPARRSRAWMRWWKPAQALMLSAAAIALAAGLYRYRTQRPAPAPAAAGAPSSLYLAAAAHLDRAQALLVELKHAPEGPGGAVNLAPERTAARALLSSNRRFQQTLAAGPAQANGMAAATLATLEPVLIEIEHAPARASRREWEAMERSLARNAILFQVRVVQQTLRARALAAKEDGSL